MQQIIKYRGGYTMVDRNDAPTHQCTRCFKPWWPDDLRPVFSDSCPNCFAALRPITKDDPIET